MISPILARIRIQGDAVMIVATRPRRTTPLGQRGVDEAVRFAKSRKIPVIYLPPPRPLPSPIGFDAAASHLYIVGGHLELCLSAALHDILSQWAKSSAWRSWTLTPDTFDEDEARLARFGVFGTTLSAFFLAEMGDKTQVATVALAAQYQAFYAVVAGTTLGMMIANVPAVLLGGRIARWVPVRLVHLIAAVLFALLGIATLAGAGDRLGI